MYLENKLGETKRQNVVLTSDVKNRQNNYNIKRSNISVLYLRHKKYHFLALDQTHPTKKPTFRKLTSISLVVIIIGPPFCKYEYIQSHVPING